MSYDDYDGQVFSTFDDDLFRTIQVRELQNEDFMLNTVERIALVANGCSIVLFYLLGDPISRKMRILWNDLANRFSGVNFFAVNASRRINIMKAFDDVKNDVDHPLNAYRLRGFPSILVYREAGSQSGIAWPKAFYNGELSTSALIDWILTLACEPGYTATPALKEGTVVDLDTIVTDPRAVVNSEVSRTPVFRTRLATTADFEDPDFDLGVEIADQVFYSQDLLEEELYRQDIDPDYVDDYRLPTANTLGDYRSSTVDDPGFLNILDDQDFEMYY
jgi:hypothetical protein